MSDDHGIKELRQILRESKTIAIVGLSANWYRPSYFAAKYLQEHGYKIIPVNPTYEGQELLGERCYGSLEDIKEPVDMVDCFRKSEDIEDFTVLNKSTLNRSPLSPPSDNSDLSTRPCLKLTTKQTANFNNKVDKNDLDAEIANLHTVTLRERKVGLQSGLKDTADRNEKEEDGEELWLFPDGSLKTAGRESKDSEEEHPQRQGLLLNTE